MKLLEKVAYKRVRHESAQEGISTVTMLAPPVDITVNNIADFLGQPIQTIKDHANPSVGVAIGLGDSYYGGRLTYIEAKKRSFGNQPSSARGLFLTGSLQLVFKESSQIAYTFARNFLQELGNSFLRENEVHLHAPEGAEKKEGPNDSLTVASALVSLGII